VLVEEPSIQEEVQIERVPGNQLVDEPVAVRCEGDIMIIPVIEEVIVVETRLPLKEEVRVTKRQISTSHHQPVRLRTEEVHVGQVPSGGPRPC
jgi:stress response protein YsnF